MSVVERTLNTNHCIISSSLWHLLSLNLSDVCDVIEFTAAYEKSVYIPVNGVCVSHYLLFMKKLASVHS